MNPYLFIEQRPKRHEQRRLGSYCQSAGPTCNFRDGLAFGWIAAQRELSILECLVEAHF
ncbi:unnamed protein product [Brassica rapa subsp. narinosa]